VCRMVPTKLTANEKHSTIDGLFPTRISLQLTAIFFKINIYILLSGIFVQRPSVRPSNEETAPLTVECEERSTHVVTHAARCNPTSVSLLGSCFVYVTSASFYVIKLMTMITAVTAHKPRFSLAIANGNSTFGTPNSSTFLNSSFSNFAFD
jgi:hypothetical protein